MMCALAATLALAACAARSPAPPAPAPESYTAETTYAKLAPAYPFIRIASRAVPPTVRAITNVTYVRRAGHDLQLDLYLPAAAATAPRPAIVFVHGGGWRAGVRANFAPMAIRMAERGYAAVTISYRLAGEAPYPAAIHDAKAAVRWVRAHAGAYGIDGDRIVIAGGSAGGQIAALTGVTNGEGRFDPDGGPGAVSSAVQAIVNIDGLSDFTSEEARRYEDDPAKQPSSAGAWFGGRYAEETALWRDASPLFHVGPDTPPVLFIGSAQRRFSVGRDAMVDRLRALGVPHRVVLVPDTPHSFWLFDPWLAPTVDATDAFLREVIPPRTGRPGSPPAA
ncbi:alpha/beta hydrolase [Massilia sp. TW-1]|uniref:Alpha/beta hydrolase n=2 Tax=Telluria antibiotica TaxID=2717319 RepID=A0ABX0P4K6_9BURK|nr:alpha/beta hydrolase [Telluria antibiotica]